MDETPLSGGIAAILQTRHANAVTLCAAVLTLAAATLDAPEARAANTFLVTTAGDPGPMGTQSLRQAIALANFGDTVQFDAGLNGSTITLQGGEIPISKGGVTIHGPGPDKLTVSGNDNSRIFNIALGNYTAYTKIDGLTLTHGKAGIGLYGGAIAASDSYLILKDARITQSTATYGGAVSLLDAGASLDNCVIVGNSADQYGGGISLVSLNHNHIDVFHISTSTISGNGSIRGGGVFALASTFVPVTFYIAYSTISGNRANASGGGLFLAIPSPGGTHVGNSTIAQNYAYVKGGGVSIYGPANVGWSTVAGNSTHLGAGNGFYIASAATLGMHSTIVANNFGGNSSSDFFGDFHADYSLLKNIGQSSVTGLDNLIGFDPMLSTLADHGGRTTTMVPSASSPVIGAGSRYGLIVDQRGLARPPSGTFKDIGAVELQHPEDVIFGSDFSFCTAVQKC
jgi:hypothetical protein